MLDVQALLSEVSADSPAGEDLAYDAGYVDLLTKAQGTPEQQIGDKVIPAEEPNWKEIAQGCQGVLKRSKDLRVGVLAMVAALKLEGVAGLADGLELLRGMIERYWDTLYPRLDPADNNDPLERTNIIAALAAPPEMFGDPMRVQRRIREAPLSSSRQLGRFGLRDMAIAAGEAPAGPDGVAVEMAVIEGSFDDTPIEDLKATGAAVDRAIASGNAIDAALEAKVGSAAAPDLGSFHRCLKEVQACVQRFLAKRGYGEAPATPAGAPAGPGGGGGEIRSAQDVLLAIDRICQYYEKYEVSSPVPLLLKRARRLVSKSFLDIITDLSPEAMNQIRAIGGISSEEKS